MALTYATGSITSPVSLGANTATKVFDTASLAIGVWAVDMGANAQCGGAGNIEIHAAADGATATLTGVTAAGDDIAAVSEELSMSLHFVAVVTGAGTLQMIGEGSNGTSNTIESASRVRSLAGVTGYRAVRIG
jgi:hypothetical protein